MTYMEMSAAPAFAVLAGAHEDAVGRAAVCTMPEGAVKGAKARAVINVVSAGTRERTEISK